jgi:HPt (histidine-containing phosphotransfer) domain-containing protein
MPFRLDRIARRENNEGMPAVNAKVIAELRAMETAGSPGFLGELIDIFIKEADGHLVKLRDSYAARDARVFTHSAHTLKGSSGNLGAQAMSRICADLQTAGHAADWTRAGAALPGLEEEYRSVRAELEAEKSRP